jgi:hypothetical protein
VSKKGSTIVQVQIWVSHLCLTPLRLYFIKQIIVQVCKRLYMVTEILLQSYLAKHVRYGPTLVDPARGHCYRLGVKTCKWNGLASESVANGSVVSLTYPVETDNAGKLALIQHRSIVLEMMLL